MLETLWVVGILGYVGNAGFNLVGVFTNGGEVTARAIFDALSIGRLYTLAQTNPPAAGGIVAGIVALTLLACLARRDSLREKAVRAARVEYEKLAAYYTLKPVRVLDAWDPSATASSSRAMYTTCISSAATPPTLATT